MRLNRLTAHEIAGRVLNREITAVDVAQACLSQIEVIEPMIRSFIEVDTESALNMAGDIDRKIATGEDPGILAGVPIALKDNLSVKDREVTCGSRILQGYVSPYDATVVKKLREAGAVFLGRTNMDEFAMGSSTENSGYWPTCNPWDPSRVPGGSSGGSAASVAADEAIVSLGSDTGGSIRQPAALCGVAGMKPTYGRVSRYGLVAYASSLDQIGPFGKDVEDIALMLEAISGHDPLDSTSAALPVPRFRDFLINDISGLKIGVPRECFIEGMEEGVESIFRDGLEVFSSLGVDIVEIELPRIPYSVACYYILSTAEASSNLARYDGVQYGSRIREGGSLLDMYESTRKQGFGEEVKRRILLGTYVLSAGYYDAYYNKSLKVRRLIKDDFDRAFSVCDCVVMPTSPCTAFKLGARTQDPLQMYLSDIFTIGVNLAGLPAISINSGFDNQGMPVGLQIIAPPFAEEKILRTAYSFERHTGFHKKRPEIAPD